MVSVRGLRNVALATKDAEAIIGSHLLTIGDDPTAATSAYGLDKKGAGECNILIYDAAADPLDVSRLIVADGIFEVLASSGNVRLGGDDFGSRLVEFC